VYQEIKIVTFGKGAFCPTHETESWEKRRINEDLDWSKKGRKSTGASLGDTTFSNMEMLRIDSECAYCTTAILDYFQPRAINLRRLRISAKRYVFWDSFPVWATFAVQDLHLELNPNEFVDYARLSTYFPNVKKLVILPLYFDKLSDQNRLAASEHHLHNTAEGMKECVASEGEWMVSALMDWLTYSGRHS
jgi:hypothetical protein